jgi:hypothetical protein
MGWFLRLCNALKELFSIFTKKQCHELEKEMHVFKHAIEYEDKKNIGNVGDVGDVEPDFDLNFEVNDELHTNSNLDSDLSKPPNPVEEFFDKKLQIAAKHIQLINSLETTSEVKNALVQYEENTRKKYDRYTELIKDEKIAEELRKIFGSQYGSNSDEVSGESHNENLRADMKLLADLHKDHGRSVVDLFNEMEDFIDSKNTRFLIEDDHHRFDHNGGKFSTYQMIPYQERILNFSKDLEKLQEEPKQFYHLYDIECDIKNLVLHHPPSPNENFTIYRDVVNNMEYVKLYNGTWQVNQYDPRLD